MAIKRRGTPAALGLQGGASYSASYTVPTGGDLLLVVSCFGAATDVITGATYNSIAMTLIGKKNSGGDRWCYLFALLNPSTGSNIVAISSVGSDAICAAAAVYCNVKQSGLPDSSAIGSNSGTTLNIATTTIADNAWLVEGVRPDTATQGTGSAPASLVIHTVNGLELWDSNSSETPPGSHSLALTNSAAGNMAGVVMSIAPSAVIVPQATPYFQPQTPVKYVNNPTIDLVAGSSYQSQLYDFQPMIDPTDSTKLVMWCSGMAAPVATGLQAVHRFTSTVADPYTWVFQSVVLSPTGSGWEQADIRVGTVLYIAGTYHLWYTGYAAGGAPGSIGHATSADGITWARSGSNPVLTPTGQGRNDGTNVENPAVYWDGISTFYMIYCYRDTRTLPGYRYATSTDGDTWTKGGSGDIFTGTTGSDGTALYNEWHSITHDKGRFSLLYEAGNTTNPYKCYCTVADSVTGPYPNTYPPLLPPSGIAGDFDRHHTATPAALKINGVWRLFYCGAGDHDQPYGTNTWSAGMANFSPFAVIQGVQSISGIQSIQM